MTREHMVTGALLVLNLAVLLATSDSGKAPGWDTSAPDRAWSEGPYELVFDAATRTVAFEASVDVGQEVLDMGAVTLQVDVTGTHDLDADAVLAVHDLAEASAPLADTPAASVTIPAAEREGDSFEATLVLPIEVAGPTLHHLVFALDGAGDLAGEVTFTLEAEPGAIPDGAAWQLVVR